MDKPYCNKYYLSNLPTTVRVYGLLLGTDTETTKIYCQCNH